MTFTRWFLVLALFLSTVAAFAAEPARFHVESIAVTGGTARVQSIVIAQSLLREGQTYSEGELADAVSRIRRLPFVRAVSFSLAKGSERGLYRLVIAVDPMEWLFFDAHARSVSGDNLSQTFNVGQVTLGGRVPVGSSGMARATVSMGDDFENLFGDREGPAPKPTFALGYSLYRIGSRAIFADVALFGREADDVTFGNPRVRFGSSLGANVIVGVPLHGSQSIRAEWAMFRAPVTFESPTGEQRSTDQTDSVQLFWLRDTTDDPLYPLHGSLVKAGALGTRQHSIGFGQSGISAQDSDWYGGQVAGSRYWGLSNERAVSLHGSYQYNTVDVDDPVFDFVQNYSQVQIGAGLTKRFSGRATDAWLDFRVDASRFDNASVDYAARVQLAHRSKWGIARLGVEYVGNGN
jgi:outer membrane protein assembly factor BamA